MALWRRFAKISLRKITKQPKMIQFLKKNRFGRATFLPLTNIRRRNSTISPAVLEDEGVIGIASSNR
ncbi:MAG: hypothetical protein ACLTS6_17325 [Anaerobutyricum sp.]